MRPELPKPVGINLQQRLAVLESATELPSAMEWRRAYTLSQLDRFAEALDLCERLSEPDQEPEREYLHAEMLIKAGADGSSDQALGMFRGLLERQLNPALRGSTLVSLSDLIRDHGAYDEAREMLHEALAIDPENPAAIRKLATLEVDTDNPDALLAFCERQVAAGVVAPRLTATYAMALAGLGRLEEAKTVRGLDELLWQGTLPTPPGFASIEEFNRELAAELIAHPSYRYENSRRASNSSWRIDELFITKSDRVKILLETINGCVEAYVRDIVEASSRAQDSLFDRFRPEHTKIAAWAVLTKAEGHEEWHIHGRGWVSGVYYVSIPKELPKDGGKAGSIGFGWSERLLGEGASERLGETIVPPEPGRLLLFPSHLHHRTWPHGHDEHRICVAFDIVPK